MNLKKPKFWDYKKPNLYAYILLPLAFLIQIISFFLKKKQKKKIKIKTICIGNFYIGGTGKTSLSIKLNKILKEKKIRSCFVKKYYKNQIDEQRILKKNGTLFLSKRRIDAIKEAEKENYQFNKMEDFSHFRFELKYFFSSHVGTQSGGEISSTAIRALIQKLTADENPRKPLSDNKIAAMLNEQNINVARRTVAKYRESLSIPPSNERKQLV